MFPNPPRKPSHSLPSLEKYLLNKVLGFKYGKFVDFMNCEGSSPSRLSNCLFYTLVFLSIAGHKKSIKHILRYILDSIKKKKRKKEKRVKSLDRLERPVTGRR